MGGPWEQVAIAIIGMVSDKELDAEQAVPWLKALIDYADRAEGKSATDDQEEAMDG
jgi:hypothetical protein